jgi:Protein of unknown function (DUF3040)
VPLSDHEQRLLEQMERALYAEDPKFADALRKTHRPAVDRKWVVLGALGVVAGLGILVGGVAIPFIPLGVLGFLVMFAGAFGMYRAFGKRSESTEQAAADPRVAVKRSSAKASNGGFMDRMEERWRKRRDERGGQF